MSLLYIKQDISHGLSVVSMKDLADATKSKDPYKEIFDRVKEKYTKHLDLGEPFLFEQTKATHMGYVNRNYSMYPVSQANKSAKSWYTPFEKPVLKNHDLHTDALGRHVHAAYVPFTLTAAQEDSIKIPKGVILTHAIITDDDAIKKVSDGRYLTVSVGATSDQMNCSICGQNWLEVPMWDDDRCEHEPGQYYDVKGRKELCYKQTGALSYHERSYVNTPADQSSSHYAGVSNFELICKSEDDLKDADYIAKNMISSKESSLIVDSMGGYVLSLEPSSGGRYPTKSPTYFFAVADSCDACDDDDDDDNDGELDWDELDRMLNEELGDAKLSPAKRNALSEKTFCGPNRSFPVPDCAHVRAALRLLGRYKGPGKKSSIRACVVRKANKLGCPVSSDADNTLDSMEDAKNVVLMPELDQTTMDSILNLDALPSTGSQKRTMSRRMINQKSARKETHQMQDIQWDRIPVQDALDNILGLQDHIEKIVRDKAEKLSSDAITNRDKALQDAATAKAALETLQTDYENILKQAKSIAVDTVMALMAQLAKPQYMKIVNTNAQDEEAMTAAMTEMRDKIASRELNSLIDTITDLKSELDAKIALDSQDDDDDDGDGNGEGDAGSDQHAMDGISDKVDPAAPVEDNLQPKTKKDQPENKSLI